MNLEIGSSSWKRPSSNNRRAAQDVISFVFEKTRNMWSTPHWHLRFLVGPSNAFHIYQISADEHRGRESRKKIAIDVALHGSVRRPKVVPGGRDFHVFHDWPLVHVITRPTPGLSVHDLVARQNGNWLRLTVSRRSPWVRLGHSGCRLNIRSACADAPCRPSRAVHPRR